MKKTFLFVSAAIIIGCGGNMGDQTVNVSIGDQKPDPIKVTGIELTPKTLDIKPGDIYPLTYTVQPAEAVNKNVTWKSDNELIAKVFSGTVYGQSEGMTTITATTEDGGKTATCQVTVLKEFIDVTEVIVLPETMTLIIGAEKQLNYQLLPTTCTNKTVTFASVDESIAIVTNTGVVKGLAEGKTKIAVIADGGKKVGYCEVNVQI